MVIIKDFELPKSCGECPMHKIWEYDTEVSCRLKSLIWHPLEAKDRHPDCPLEEKKRWPPTEKTVKQ